MNIFIKIVLRLTLPIIWAITLCCTVFTIMAFFIPGLIAAFICWTITSNAHWDLTVIWPFIPIPIMLLYMDWLKNKDVIK